MKVRLSGFITGSIVFILGLLSLLAPFILPQARKSGFQSTTTPIMTSLLIMICLFIIFYEAQTSLLDTKMIAMLGILIAINAGLRFLENAIPGPAGFSPVFLLIILTGYFFGSRIGFLTGALTMLVSGLITGGVGPWLPGQMITAGWVGQSSALMQGIIQSIKAKGKPIEWILLSLFAAVWGFLYGGIMNLWFWPFMAGDPTQSWQVTSSLADNFQRYAAYYLATSIIWDTTRAVGNVLFMLMLAKPILKLFQRFDKRFSFTYRQAPIQ